MDSEYIKSLEARIEKQQELISYFTNWRANLTIPSEIIKISYYQCPIGDNYPEIHEDSIDSNFGKKSIFIMILKAIYNLKNIKSIKIQSIRCIRLKMPIVWEITLDKKMDSKYSYIWEINSVFIRGKEIKPKQKTWNCDYLFDIFEKKY